MARVVARRWVQAIQTAACGAAMFTACRNTDLPTVDGGSSQGGGAGAAGADAAGAAGATPNPTQPTTSNGRTSGQVDFEVHSQELVLLEDTSVNLILEAHPPQNKMQVEVVSSPTLGVLDSTRGRVPLFVIYSPNPDAFGLDTFSFIVSDADGNRSPPANVALEIVPVNDAPVARDDSAQTNSLTPIDIDVLANDSDVDNSTAELQLVEVQTNADVTLSERGLHYVPDPSFSGTERMSYTIRDPEGLEASAEVTIQVNPAINTSDLDGDGLSNETELRLGSDPLDADTDDDGVPDGVENANKNDSVDAGETDPRLPDSDGDGICDGLRQDNEGDKDGDGDLFDPSSDCLGPVLVDAENQNSIQDGATWATAFSNLNEAVAAADGIRPVWVAEGLYQPEEPEAPVAEAPEGSQIFGGFSGTETYLNARNPASRATVLDGDFALDDVQQPKANRTDNSQSVVVLLGSGKLDGFLIRNGERTRNDAWLGAGVSVVGGEVTLENLTLEHHHNQFDGGAIGCGAPCELTLVSSSLQSNSARRGGAVFLEADLAKVSVEFENVDVSTNHATIAGGAVYAEQELEWSVAGSQFSSNTSDGDGGALYLNGTQATLDDCELVDNQATAAGGAIFNAGELELVSVTLLTNHGNFGGALLNSAVRGRGNAAVRQTTFDGNQARAEGGAIHSHNAALELLGSQLIDNSAANFGGAILHWGSQLLVEGSQLARNNSGSAGGAVRSYQAETTVRDSSFEDNQTLQRGAGLEHWYGSILLSNVRFANNEGTGAAPWGGGMVCDSASCELTEVTFENNKANDAGGLLCTDAECSILEALFSGQHADASGGGVYCLNSQCQVAQVSFEDNTADNSGAGAVCNASICDLEQTRFRLNAGAHAGAMSCALGSTCTYSQTAFLSNKADLNAGALYCHSSTCNLVDSEFFLNGAAFGGALMCLEGSSCSAEATSYVMNSANTSGGALYQQNATVDLRRSVFLQNSAAYGGAVFGYLAPQLSGRELAFVENGATTVINGGAVYTDDTPSTLSDSVFSRNLAQFGGAAYHRVGVRAEYVGVSFSGNHAVRGGGALRVTEGAGLLLNSVALMGNSADERAGAIESALGAQSTLTNVSLFGNQAVNAGAIYTPADSRTDVFNSIFFDNTDASGVSDLVDLASPPSSVEYVQSQQPLPGNTNISISQSPFVVSDQALLLDPTRSGVDAGSDSRANDPEFGFTALGSVSWQDLTTSPEGGLDTSPVDLGRHYHAGRVRIGAGSSNAEEQTWQVGFADSCHWYNLGDAGHAPAPLAGSGANQSVTIDNTQMRDRVVLVCFGEGEPAVATASQ